MQAGLLSHEITASGCPRCSRGGRQHCWRRYRESLVDPAWSEIHGMYGTSMRENREIPRSPVRLITGRAAQGTRGGTPEMHERGKSDRPRSTCEPAEQGRGSGRGGGGGKGSEPRGTRPAKRIPDPVPEPVRPVRWTVCGRWHDGTRTRGSPRCCTMSTSSGSGRPIGRSARQAAPGVDGVTWDDYGRNLVLSVVDLAHGGVAAGEAGSGMSWPRPNRFGRGFGGQVVAVVVRVSRAGGRGWSR